MRQPAFVDGLPHGIAATTMVVKDSIDSACKLLDVYRSARLDGSVLFEKDAGIYPQFVTCGVVLAGKVAADLYVVGWFEGVDVGGFDSGYACVLFKRGPDGFAVRFCADAGNVDQFVIGSLADLRLQEKRFPVVCISVGRRRRRKVRGLSWKCFLKARPNAAGVS